VEHHYKQVVFINKPLTLRGGFTESNWSEPDPIINVTTIDALGDGRPVSIVDTQDQAVVLDGFTLTGGDYTGLGNPQGEANFVCASTGEDCGGGLYVHRSAFHLRNSVVSGNVGSTVAGRGGGIYLWWARTSSIENTRVSNNVTAYTGGGLFVMRQYVPLLLRDSSFEENTASGGGGVEMAANIQALIRVEDCLIRGNTATSGRGGGMSARLATDSGILELARVSIQDNQAWGQGKGLFLDSAGEVAPHARIENVLFSGNTSVSGAPQADSDALLAVGPGFTSLNVELAHVTAADNTVRNFLHAVTYLSGGPTMAVTAANVLLSGFDNAYAAEEVADGEVTIEHSNTLFHEVTTSHLSLGGTPTFIQTDPVAGDPLLDSEYRLQAGSAAIDAGIDAGVDDDIDENPRPAGKAPDIGIDELESIFADGFEARIE
jgi:hypothetical protein